MAQRKPLVLAVDDEPDVLQLIQTILEPEGYQVITTTDGAQTHSLVKEKGPDIVLLDIRMPGKSGIEVLGGLKGLHPDTAVIMVTGIGDTQTAVQAMRMGASDYLIKPFSMDQLTIAVERAMDKRMMTLQLRDYQINLENKVADKTQHLNQKIAELTALNQLFQTHLKQRTDVQEAHQKVAGEIARLAGEIQTMAGKAFSGKELPEASRRLAGDIATLADEIQAAAKETVSAHLQHAQEKLDQAHAP